MDSFDCYTILFCLFGLNFYQPARDLEAKQLSSSPSWYESTEDQGSLYKVSI